MTLPHITVVTICRNSAATLEETMQSVLSQDYPPEAIDYVVIDGGSTDGTQDIALSHRDRLGYFVSEPDGGISDAFNKGIRAARGDVIVIINSDDVLLPGAMRAVAAAWDGVTDIYRGNVIIRNKDTGFVGRDIPSMRFPLVPLYVNVDHQGTFVTRACYERFGLYDTKFRYMMDHDFLTRCYQGGARLKRVEADVAEFRLGGVSVAPITAKRYDIRHIVLNNGGSRWLADMVYAYFWTFDLAKRIFIRCFGIDALKRIHYRKPK